MTKAKESYEVKRAIERSMTVADLINRLQDCDPDAPVFFRQRLRRHLPHSAGLAAILERRGKTFAIFELISNAWDSGATEVQVTLNPNDANRFLNVLGGVVGRRLTYRQLAAVGDAGFMGIR